MQDMDELYDRLLETTTEILDAASAEDVGRLGRAIDARQMILERFAGAGTQIRTPEQRAKLNEIIILDRKAGAQIHRVFEKYQENIRRSRAKYDGMVRYNNSRFDLSSGRMIDKKR